MKELEKLNSKIEQLEKVIGPYDEIMSDKIEKTVKSRINKWLLAILAVIITVFGYFGINTVNDINDKIDAISQNAKSKVKKELQMKIDSMVVNQEEKIEETVNEKLIYLLLDAKINLDNEVDSISTSLKVKSEDKINVAVHEIIFQLKKENIIDNQTAQNLEKEIKQKTVVKENVFKGDGYSYYGFWDKKKEEWNSVQFTIVGINNNDQIPKIGDKVEVNIGKKIPVFSNYIRFTINGWKNTATKGYLENGQKVIVKDLKENIGKNKVWIKFETE